MGILVSGLCSVSFRDLSAVRIVDLAAAAGLESVEWGGDVHVPLGDIVAARDVAARCANVGIACDSYGSYVCAGHVTAGEADRLVETTLALGASNARVWCPFGLLPGATGSDRARVVEQLAEVADVAARAGLRVSVEFHAGTLTQTADSARQLIADVGAPNLFTYWQPRDGVPVPALLGELELLLPCLAHLHVYRWDAHGTRLPLAAGSDLWPGAFRLVSEAETAGETTWGLRHVAFLEFVEDDDPGLLARDARVLRRWLAEV